MTSQTNILYPLALNAAGITIPVRDANHGGIYNCLGCNQIMIAKQGEFRKWHYAHKSQQANTCNPDLVLHRTAQELILAGFRQAVAQEGEYMLGRLCTRCGGHIIKNAAQADATINREVSAVPGTRADLVITYSDNDRLVLEVVNTNNLSEATTNKYSQSNIRVLKIRPIWVPQDDGPNTVASEPRHDELNLYEGALAYETLNITPSICTNCKKLERSDREDTTQQQYQNEGYFQSRIGKKRAADAFRMMETVFDVFRRLEVKVELLRTEDLIRVVVTNPTIEKSDRNYTSTYIFPYEEVK